MWKERRGDVQLKTPPSCGQEDVGGNELHPTREKGILTRRVFKKEISGIKKRETLRIEGGVGIKINSIYRVKMCSRVSRPDSRSTYLDCQ